MVLLFYTTHISVDLAHHKIFRAKVGKGGINLYNVYILILQKKTNRCVFYNLERLNNF